MDHLHLLVLWAQKLVLLLAGLQMLVQWSLLGWWKPRSLPLVDPADSFFGSAVGLRVRDRGLNQQLVRVLRDDVRLVAPAGQLPSWFAIQPESAP